MATPTKFDALLQLHFLGECGFEELAGSFGTHAKFEGLSRRSLLGAVKKLRDEGLTRHENGVYAPLYESEARRLLAFLFWCRKDGIDFNALLKGRPRLALEKVAGMDRFKVGDLGFSRATSFKYLKLLKNANFLQVVKKKPATAVLNVNDRTLHYPFSPGAESKILRRLERSQHRHISAFSRLKVPHSHKFRDNMAMLHAYSSTVTEGNTASESDVERVVSDLATKLTPKEIMEIKNVKDAVDFLLEEKNTGLSVEYIKELHRIVMRGLLENPGKFEASAGKRIVGSGLKLPASLDSVRFSIDSMLGFYSRNRKNASPLILACILHFWFVTVHPFPDGNGRVARLIHSKILVDNGLPVFVYDPNGRNEYFKALEESRNTSIEGFLEFALREHIRAVKEL